MNNIDYIYYVATTTDEFGVIQSVTQSSYFIPFFDFLMVFLVLILSIVSVLTFDYLCYRKNSIIKLKNILKITKKVKF